MVLPKNCNSNLHLFFLDIIKVYVGAIYTMKVKNSIRKLGLQMWPSARLHFKQLAIIIIVGYYLLRRSRNQVGYYLYFSSLKLWHHFWGCFLIFNFSNLKNKNNVDIVK